jgi:hypothetical protein
MDATLPKPKTRTMRKFIISGGLLLVLLLATSCEVVGGIFKAGMGVGIFIVIAIIAVIVWVISRFSKK